MKVQTAFYLTQKLTQVSIQPETNHESTLLASLRHQHIQNLWLNGDGDLLVEFSAIPKATPRKQQRKRKK